MYHRLGLVPRQLYVYNHRRHSAGSAITQGYRDVLYAMRELSMTTTCQYALSASTEQSSWTLDMLTDMRAARRKIEHAAEVNVALHVSCLPQTGNSYPVRKYQQLSCFFFSPSPSARSPLVTVRLAANMGALYTHRATMYMLQPAMHQAKPFPHSRPVAVFPTQTQALVGPPPLSSPSTYSTAQGVIHTRS